MMENRTVFVSIASYCDPMLSFTIQSALETASQPDRLHISVVNQSSPIDLSVRSAKLSLVDIAPEHSGGACWARSLAQSNYDGEDFFLQVDSHTLFDDGWDQRLIESYTALAPLSNDYVISSRPQAFDYDEETGPRPRPFTTNTVKLVPRETTITRKSPAIMFKAYGTKSPETLRGYQISAAFLFAPGSFIRRIPYDPMLYFHGEEQNIAIRAFTHGIDIFHIADVPLLHLYKKRAEAEPALHWSKDQDAQRAIRYARRKERANALLWGQLTEPYGGAFGNGTVRPVSEYLASLGLTLADAVN